VQIVLCAALAAVAALLLPIQFPWPWLRYVLMAAGASMTLAVERRGIAMPEKPLSGALLAPSGSFLVACAILWFHLRSAKVSGEGMWPILAVLGSVWFVLAVLMLNRSSLRLASRAHLHREIPAGVRRAGLFGTALFLVAAFMLSKIGAIAKALSTSLDAIFRWLIAAYVWLCNLLPQQGVQEQGGGKAQPQPLPVLPGAESQIPLWEQILLNVLAALIFLGAVALLLFGLYKGLPKLWQKIRERLAGLLGSWHDEAPSYEDKTESLLSLRQALSQAGDKLSRFARRFRRRARLSDFHTNAEKARFLFRELMNRLKAADKLPPPGATPAEITSARTRTDGMKELSRSYALARYAEEEPDEADIRAAAKGMEMK
jgi:hypothetical protein